ncbi:hypothetical protein BKA69DRAFT_1057720 [Paraphysoderma sedebokerense]|nr:hypothetical protein BKA69DRAFT_1057720 [Paraphysoderma sedebokerense]
MGPNESNFMSSQSDSVITPASVHTNQQLHPPRGASNFEQHPSRQIESVNLSPGQTNAFDTRSSNSGNRNSTDSRPYPLILPGHVQSKPESSIHNPQPQRQIQSQLHAQNNQEISANTRFSHPPILQTHHNRSSFPSHHQQEHLSPHTPSSVDSQRPQSVPPLGIRQDTKPLETQPQTQQSTASVINLSDTSDPSVPPVSQSKSPNSRPSTLDQINLSVPPLPRVDTNIPALSLISDDAPLLSPEELDSLLDHKSADTHKSEKSHNIIPTPTAPVKQDMDGDIKGIIPKSEGRKSPETESNKQEKRSSHGMFKRMLSRSSAEDVKLGEDKPEAVKGESHASFNDASIIDLPKPVDLKRKKSKKRKLQPPLPPKELNRYPTPIEPKRIGPHLTPPQSPFPNRISLPSPSFSEKELPVPSQLPNLPDLSPLKIPLTPVSPAISTSKSAPSLSRTPSMASLIPTLSRSMKSAKLLQNDDTNSSISDSSDPSSPVSDPAKRQKSIETLNTALQFYRNGSGDFSAAYALFQKAAKQGNSFAYFYMGECHYHGSKVSNFKQDFTKAFEFYSKAVAGASESSLTPPPVSPHEVPESCYLGYIGLADCHFFGFAPDTDRDPTKAYSYYNMVLSIVTNHQQKYSHVSPLPQGLTPKLLSRVYAGVADIFYDQSEYVNAVYMYQKAIQLDPGCKRAMTRLAVCMFLGVGGVQKDVDEGRKLLRKVRGVKREVEAWILYYKEIGDEVMVNKYKEESKRFVDY